MIAITAAVMSVQCPDQSGVGVGKNTAVSHQNENFTVFKRMYVTFKNVSAVPLRFLLQVTMPAMQLTSLEHTIKCHNETLHTQWKQIIAVSYRNNFS